VRAAIDRMVFRRAGLARGERHLLAERTWDEGHGAAGPVLLVQLLAPDGQLLPHELLVAAVGVARIAPVRHIPLRLLPDLVVHRSHQALHGARSVGRRLGGGAPVCSR
jgi:hypothetical protein